MITSQIQSLINSTGVKSSGPNQILGKDDFLKLLITQLQNQDYTKVQDDKEFISQLAQFSSMEQTKQMADNLSSLVQFQQLSQASSLLYTQVELKGGQDGGNIKGMVSEVKMVQGLPKILVNGTEYDLDSIVGIK